MHTTTDLHDLTRELGAQIESFYMDELNDLINKGILVIRHQDPKFFQKSNGEVELSQHVKFELKDKEYIEKLEAENRMYKNLIKQLKVVIDFHPAIKRREGLG